MNRFELRLRVPKSVHRRSGRGTIIIGDFRESFTASFHFWRPEQYLENWCNSLRLMLNGSARGCFITNMNSDLKGNNGYGMSWEFFRVDKDIVFHNRLIMPEAPIEGLASLNPEPWVEERETVTEDGFPISEWRVRRENLRVNLKLTV